MIEVRKNVYWGAGTDVNWFVIRDGSDLTLIDSGYPGDTARLLASIESIGAHPRDVRAILLTHAHIDHMGGINHFHEKYGTPVYTTATETAHARREYLEQATELDVARNIWRRGVVGWSARITLAGATKKVSIPHAQAFPSPLDLPGSPIPVPTSGHTSGHCAYYLPAVGAIATGDELVTGHALLRDEGPQLLPDMFHHNRSDVVAALGELESVEADLVLPGHGKPAQIPIRDAVADVRARIRARRG